MAGSRCPLRVACAVAVAGLAVAGCGLVPTAGPRIECTGIPAARCPGLIREAEDMARPGGPPISSITIRAVNPPCTEQACQGETLVVFANGTNASSGWGWQGAGPAQAPPTGPLPTRPPDGVVRPTCIGLPADKCAEFASVGGEAGATPDPTVVTIEVACTKLPCTAELGMGRTTITHQDGTRETAQWSYSGAGPAPPP